MNTPSQKQTGAALVVALFVVALVAAASIAMLDRFRIDIRRTELIFRANQATLLASGSVDWAIDTLNNNWKLQQTGQLIDKTPITSTPKIIQGAIITSTLYDAQDKFNIANLSDAKNQTDFIQLLHVIAPDLSPDNAKSLTAALVDWITPGKHNTAFDQYYATLSPPYRAGHTPIASISEIRMLKGMNAKLYNKLLPSLTALPTPTPVNINNAPATVLMSLSPTLTSNSAQAIVNYRAQNPFTSTNQFVNFDIIKNNAIDEKKITVTSQYFLVHTEVKIGEQDIVLYTLLNRQIKNKQPATNIVWQSKGTL